MSQQIQINKVRCNHHPFLRKIQCQKGIWRFLKVLFSIIIIKEMVLNHQERTEISLNQKFNWTQV